MKKRVTIAAATALMLGLASLSYAAYVSGFKVTAVSDDRVTIRKGDATPVEVTGVKGKFKVGDQVKYDAKKGKLLKLKPRKHIIGC